MNEFKDSANRWLTSGLFKETASPQSKRFVKFTVEEMRQRYVDCGDPTGIAFADRWLGGYAHWKAIKACEPLQGYIAEWEEELEARIRSAALRGIAQLAEDGQFQAGKFLMDRGWDKRKAGTPSKAEVQRETRVQAKIKEEFRSDVTRIDRSK